MSAFQSPKLALLGLLLVTVLQAIHGQQPAVAPDLAAAGDNANEIRAFIEAAEKQHGAAGARAANFLVRDAPEADLRTLTKARLLENLELALRARKEFSWCQSLPEELFLNDVLPYACLDEPRHPWRRAFYEKARPLVASCRSATEAAQALNKKFFDAVGVHYSRARSKANQSPQESIEQGKASCTGLSILLVDACRAVGIPARVAGTPNWSDKRGNHTWVEIWDGGWHFTGADEFDSKGLDRAWFKKDAAKARADAPEHAIYASSWKRTGTHFPLVWSRSNTSVFAVNVTSRYAAPQEKAAPAQATVGLRVVENRGGQRLAAAAALVDGTGKRRELGHTNAGRTDWNDVLRFPLEVDQPVWLHLQYGSVAKQVPLVAAQVQATNLELIWSEIPAFSEARRSHLGAAKTWLAVSAPLRPKRFPAGWGSEAPLTREEAGQIRALMWERWRTDIGAARKAELDAKAMKADGVTLRFEERVFGKAPKAGHSLYISLHGGGGAPKLVNDSQWKNQVGLYKPEEGIYVAPRAPTDTWNLWHEKHIDPLFDRLIESYVALRGVDPNRVYLLGYSAGGDGVYQLGPRMADRFAAASMMAGHPNEATPFGLRNLSFAIFVGGQDAAYKRNKVAVEWAGKLSKLKEQDPDGYVHKLTVYEDCGHWMKGRDKEALPWMAGFVRKTWPKKVAWLQDDVTHERFYWLALPQGEARKGQRVTAVVEGQAIRLKTKGTRKLTLRLSDDLLDLDKPVEVSINGRPLFKKMVARSIDAMIRSLEERADPGTMASAYVDLDW
jgi:hypothetical protein